jgi:hypothetical protein
LLLLVDLFRDFYYKLEAKAANLGCFDIVQQDFKITVAKRMTLGS